MSTEPAAAHLSQVKIQLHDCYALELNESKTRIASQHGRQMVTGIVVNTNVLPPREKRREIRVIFHCAEKMPAKYVERIEELAGHIGYLNQFPSYKGGEAIACYRDVLKRVVSERLQVGGAENSYTNETIRKRKGRIRSTGGASKVGLKKGPRPKKK